MSLEDLPAEILDHIASYLTTYPALLALSWTSRTLYISLHASPSASSLQRHSTNRDHRRRIPTRDLLTIETWTAFSPTPHPSSSHEFHPVDVPDWAIPHVRENKYACRLCRTLKPPRAFTGAMISGKRGKARPGAEERFCVACGVASQRYQKGALLQLGHPVEGLVVDEKTGDGEEKAQFDGMALSGDGMPTTGIVCKRCGKFRAVPAQSREGIRRLCPDCIRYRPPGGRMQVWERGFPLPDGE